MNLIWSEHSILEGCFLRNLSHRENSKCVCIFGTPSTRCFSSFFFHQLFRALLRDVSTPVIFVNLVKLALRKALDEIYKIYPLLQRFELQNPAKFRQTCSHVYNYYIFQKFTYFCNCCPTFTNFDEKFRNFRKYGKIKRSFNILDSQIS